MTVVDLKTRKPKRRKHAPRDLPLEKASGSARFFQRMIRDIGLSRRTVDVTPPLSEYLQSLRDEDVEEAS